MVPTWILQKLERLTSQARPHWRNKKEVGAQIQSSGNTCVYDYEVSAEATPVLGVQTQPTWSFLLWQSAEALYDPGRQTLDILQAIGLANKVW